ncbi:mannitol dehydrogenase family protein [Paracoccus caeni]|uniref:Mannitol dehydrogenase family protein n=1 Tax=Paracoccus caeni TaxID=657651 RepID=A0A934W1N3_9RHOB|nr:mannitol dehydrogenase family protein [Paracoccus caeni]MBK4217548.1 mannitol dehydrogenase family protein [Paracoccus caeni]
MTSRLTNLSGLPPNIRLPGYDRAAHGVGILHLGLGAFHRAHQAVATDDALAAGGGDWRILGANLRSRDMAEAMTAQNGLYTVLIRDKQVEARIIGAHATTMGGDPAAILKAACDPRIRILSLTVSEKAYGIDRDAMDIDEMHPAVAADLLWPQAPSGVLGLITAALAARRAAGIAPFTVLSCDNLPDNGALLRAGVLGFAARIRPSLANWIEENVAFPSTVVDRITPASTERTYSDALELTGHHDAAAVETEAFSQWVIEDHFPQGRPLWEAGGATFVRDVGPHEAMKLRMLNGSHSLIAYMGQLVGMRYVRDVVAQPALAALVRRHMKAAAATLPPSSGLDPDSYADTLMQRFANPAIAHRTSQIAIDGTEKLPQRWLVPAAEMLAAGQDARPFAFAIAVWLAWLSDLSKRGEAPDDPRGDRLRDTVNRAGDDDMRLVEAVLSLPGLAPACLTGNNAFMQIIRQSLSRIRHCGFRMNFPEALSA